MRGRKGRSFFLGKENVRKGQRVANPEAERSKTWIEPKPKAPELKVAVIYYLSRNGQLEHPHLMEVPISSPQGMLCLKDVINTLNFLRGQGMANLYYWSAKRSYKNGFVWQDLSEDDFIYPSTGHEYALKGTQIMETCLSFRSYETISTPSSKSSLETNSSSTDADSPATIKGRSQSLSSCEFKLYKQRHAGSLLEKLLMLPLRPWRRVGKEWKRSNLKSVTEMMQGGLVRIRGICHFLLLVLECWKGLWRVMNQQISETRG